MTDRRKDVRTFVRTSVRTSGNILKVGRLRRTYFKNWAFGENRAFGYEHILKIGRLGANIFKKQSVWVPTYLKMGPLGAKMF